MARHALLAAVLALTACAAADDPGASSADVAADGAEVRTLFAGTSTHRQLASDGEFVYSTELRTKEVLKIPLDGGAPTVLWTGRGMDALYDVTVDDGWVYFTEDGRILRVPTAGGRAEELVRLAYEGPTYLATDATHVYWGGVTDFAVGYDAYIRRVAKTGGPIETVYTGYEGVDAIALADGYVYFSGRENVVMNPPALLMRVPAAGGAPPETVLRVDGSIRALALDDARAYVAVVVDRRYAILSVARTGGPAETLVEMPLTETNTPSILVAGDRAVYWASPGTFDFSRSPPDNHDAHVYRADKAGGPRVTVASRIGSPQALVLAGGCPVWSSGTTVETTRACD